ncbi:MAG TPA: fumarylacetoacetate hydrolase family protein [Chitinophagaceae bacterium]|nr:fumarylacetoacetate hydrolase family protein [Chitinophagaceae bacterium]
MIRIYKTGKGIVIENDNKCFISPETNWNSFINSEGLYRRLQQEIKALTPVGDTDWLTQQEILAPIGAQEVWAAGVTYLRSKIARMEESEVSGGATFYDKVYDAERPELFFKSTASKVISTNGLVRIRKDSSWNVPEPELTLVVTSSGKIVGYSIGNDMSSRSIEGENPLYLPQAKMYDGSASVGPCVLVTEQPISPDTVIAINIDRDGKTVFEGSTTIDRMKRKHEELVEFLFREYSHPVGCYLMTGTCVVPENDFTLYSGDVIKIRIDNIGELVNTVA